MKNVLLFIFLFGVSHFTVAQHRGKVVEGLTIKSDILDKEVSYTMYFPPGFDYSERTYPVLYLLHGYTDDDTGWVQFGEVNRYADAAIAAGDIPPMVIAMPDGGVSWYINSYDGETKYEDFFIQEFMPAIEKNPKIKSQKRFRGIAGLSMGGYGTFIYALKYPELFAACAPLSAAISSDEAMANMPQQAWDRTFGQLYGRELEGEERLTEAWYDNSPLKIIENKSKEELSQLGYWIDCGDDDFLAVGNSLLHIALTQKQIPHEYRVRDGAHTWTYWRTGITDAMRFIGDYFRQK